MCVKLKIYKKVVNVPPKLFIRKSIGFVYQRVDDKIMRYVDFHRCIYATK